MDTTTAHILDSLGWAVTHSLWQGALAALAVYLFRAATKDNQAGLRCGFELMALGLCFAAFIGTFVLKALGPISPAPVISTFTDIIAPLAVDPVTSGPAETMSPLAGRTLTQYTPLLGFLWCLGFLFLATRYSIGFAMTHRLRTRGLSDAPAGWQNRFQTLVLNSGIFKTVTLHVSSRVSGPMTFGFFKPVVLVPASFFTGLPADQIESILLHEIAHIRRHDYLINLFQTAIKIILFFHPAIHYISRCVDDDREKACDDFAVNYTKNPAALAKGLATLRLNLEPPNFAMSASNKRNPLLRRLTRLTTPEESRRRPGQSWGQLATTLTALVVAAGIYSSTNVEYASAHVPAADATRTTNTLHVSADKKNYHFSTIWHDGREIAIKTAGDQSRWVYFNNSWFNIDKNPKILDAVPETPTAPQMPRRENFNSDMKFEKSFNQYRVSLDYYIAALEINACQSCTKSKLHWAKKQKARVSHPKPDFDQDLLWKETAPKHITPPMLSPKPVVQAEPNSTPTPTPQVQPISAPTPIAAPQTIIKISDLAGAPKIKTDTFYMNGNQYDADSWEERTEDEIDRVAEKFEDKMDNIQDDFEDAMDKFEQAAENFARNPVAKKDYFNRAQKEFATAVLAANEKRAELSTQFDRDINDAVDKHVQHQTSHIQQTVDLEVHKALELAWIEADNAHKSHPKAYKQNYKTDHNTNNKSHYQNQATSSHPTYSDYGQVMLAQLGNDGVIPHGTKSVNIEYKSGDMYVNGSIVNKDTADNYCSINSAFNIEKSNNMRIEVKPERLTITDYNY